MNDIHDIHRKRPEAELESWRHRAVKAELEVAEYADQVAALEAALAKSRAGQGDYDDDKAIPGSALGAALGKLRAGQPIPGMVTGAEEDALEAELLEPCHVGGFEHRSSAQEIVAALEVIASHLWHIRKAMERANHLKET